jgi:radical SAM protein with 4Fe4S-binding SPASM domain
VSRRQAGDPVPTGPLYQRLAARLEALRGPATGRPRAQTASTRDGKGILFIAHDGEINPAGFLPLPLGNVRDETIATIYRDDPLLRRIRDAEFTGRCGRCEYADLCGGSRARAFAASGDPLGEDSACLYEPADSPDLAPALVSD